MSLRDSSIKNASILLTGSAVSAKFVAEWVLLPSGLQL